MSDFPYAGISGINPTDRWEDLRFPAAGINPPGAVADPTVNTTNGLLEFAAAATNTIAFQVQLPHAWEEGSELHAHVHWRKKTQGTGKVYWRLTYEFQNPAGTFTDTPATLNATTVVDATPDDGTALVHLITSLGTVDMAGKKISCMGMCTLSRIGGDNADDYAGVAQLLEVDFHYKVDSFGSVYEWIKQNTAGVAP